jgi:hypothetical protein
MNPSTSLAIHCHAAMTIASGLRTRGERMRIVSVVAALLAVPVMVAAREPPSCGFEFGAEPERLGLARVARGDQGQRLHFRETPDTPPCATAGCPAGPYLLVGDEVITEQRHGDHVCAWYKPKAKDRYGTVGWLPVNALTEVPVATDPPLAAWKGEWLRDVRLDLSTSIKVQPTRDGRLKVEGLSLYAADRAAIARGAINDGVIDDVLEVRGRSAGPMLPAGDGRRQSFRPEDHDDCRIGLALVGDYLVVLDNLGCGGRNVDFRGVYRRLTPKGRNR